MFPQVNGGRDGAGKSIVLVRLRSGFWRVRKYHRKAQMVCDMARSVHKHDEILAAFADSPMKSYLLDRRLGKACMISVDF
jgi:hypothetical protein